MFPEASSQEAETQSFRSIGRGLSFAWRPTGGEGGAGGLTQGLFGYLIPM